jgi:adenylate cyclase class 2
MKEIETKFYIRDAARLKDRLESLGAQCVRERLHEHNLRFDKPSGDLSGSFKVLRLRRDRKNLLTFKAPGESQSEVSEREEIEFEVSDFKAAQMLLEALDFQVIFVYEKFRTIFRLNDVELSLDETPLGTFVELEGPDGGAIRRAAESLELSWAQRVTDSYADLFDLAKFSLDLAARDMTFANFEGLKVLPQAMGLKPADPSRAA